MRRHPGRSLSLLHLCCILAPSCLLAWPAAHHGLCARPAGRSCQHHAMLLLRCAPGPQPQPPAVSEAVRPRPSAARCCSAGDPFIATFLYLCLFSAVSLYVYGNRKTLSAAVTPWVRGGAGGGAAAGGGAGGGAEGQAGRSVAQRNAATAALREALATGAAAGGSRRRGSQAAAPPRLSLARSAGLLHGQAQAFGITCGNTTSLAAREGAWPLLKRVRVCRMASSE